MTTQSTQSIVPPGVGDIVQKDTLVRIFRDTLYPQLLFRMEAYPDKWEANIGDRLVETRSGELSVDPTPTQAGADPIPENVSYEQWEILAQQLDKTVDTNMPASRTAQASLALRDGKNLGLNAGRTMNRLARNKLFCAYAGWARRCRDRGCANDHV